MGGSVELAFKLSKEAINLIKAGKAFLSSGGVRMVSGELFELAKPVVSGVFSAASGVGLGSVGAAVNIASSLGSNVQCAFIQKGVNMANVKLDTVITQLGSISNALHSLQQIQVLSWVNTAFSLANCGISIAGFQMTLKRLDGVNGQLKAFYDRYKQDRQNDKVEVFQRIILDLKGHLAFLQSLRKTASINRQGFSQREPFIEGSLNEARSFLKAVLEDFQNRRIDGTIGCQIIFTLSAIYTQVMNEFCCWYHYTHNEKHVLFQDWYNLFEEIDSQAFRGFLKEHLTFDLTYADVSPSRKLNAYQIAFESIHEQKNLLLACSEAVSTLSDSEYRQVEVTMNQNLIKTISDQLLHSNIETIDKTMSRCILEKTYMEDDNQIIIPLRTIEGEII